MYVAMENGGTVQAISTLTNQVVATIPIGQTAQALVYVPDAVPTGTGSENLVPLGDAATVTHLELEGDSASALPHARASVAVNSLGLLDLMEIAASGLRPLAQYQVYLASTNQAPYAKIEKLTILRTNPDSAAIAQAIGPLKRLQRPSSPSADDEARRYLLVTALDDASEIVLRQP